MTKKLEVGKEVEIKRNDEKVRGRERGRDKNSAPL